MASTSGLTPYSGKEKLILSFDLGATQSAVSFVHLYPGEIPQVRFVNRWPGQEEAAGYSKTPSLICYEKGKAIAFGAQALQAGSERAQLARWWKLHLNPRKMRQSYEPASIEQYDDIPPLPKGVNLGQIYADFIRYLFEHTRSFFASTIPDGSRIWSRLNDTIAFVFATPNGWDDVQQHFLRNAAMQAKLLPSATDPVSVARLTFVTESESSIHSALHHHSTSGWLQTGDLIALLDAGGATADLSLYHVTAHHPKVQLEEVCASECIQAGSAFVDLEAMKMLRVKLAASRFSGEEFIHEIIQEFERKTKRQFDGSRGNFVIKFGRESDNDKDFGIARGRLTLTHVELKYAFEHSFTLIKAGTQKVLGPPGRKPKYLLMVGGYGASPYLQKFMRKICEPAGIQVVTIDDTTHKAAVEGAALWVIRHSVTARAARSTYGVSTSRSFDPKLSSHQLRAHLAYTNDFGSQRLPGGLDVWVKKGQVVNESHRQTTEYVSTWASKDKVMKSLATFRVNVLAYDGNDDVQWCQDLQGNDLPGIRAVCALEADLSSLAHAIHMMERPNGEKYWKLTFKVAVAFGGTSISASLQWMEGSELREGPIGVIPVD